MDDFQRLIDKIRKIQALHDGATTGGERAAARAALDRLQAGLATAEPEKEFKFSLDNTWSVRLLMALLHKAGIRPYRKKGQRRTTVMARMKTSYCDQVLWPEFQKIAGLLHKFLDETADRVIASAVGAAGPDVQEV